MRDIPGERRRHADGRRSGTVDGSRRGAGAQTPSCSVARSSSSVKPTDEVTDDTCDRSSPSVVGSSGAPPKLVECSKGIPAQLLTVVVPVFNEVRTIDELLRRIAAAPYDKQIIVVDDGSTDGTVASLDRWSLNGSIELYHHRQNSGKGRAIRTALSHARGEFTIIQDADLELDPRDYPLLLEPLRDGAADLVVGSRFVGDKLFRASSLSFFRLGVCLLNLTVRLLYAVRVTDEACCYKALRTGVLRQMNLQCERFEFCPEVIAKASRMGLRTREVGIRYVPRSVAAGKKIRYRDGFAALWCLWKLRRSVI